MDCPRLRWEVKLHKKFGMKKLLKIMVLLQVFRSPANFSTKDGMVNPRAKKFVFLGVKRNMKSYRLWEPEIKKIVMSQHALFDETSGLKSIISQQVERTRPRKHRSGWRLMLLYHLQMVQYQ